MLPKIFELEDQDSKFPYGFWVTGHRATEHPLVQIRVWCEERFGKPGTVWKIEQTDVWFTEENHAMEFKLRWF